MSNTNQAQDMSAILAELNALKAENEALKVKKASGSIKISEKGAVSVYGLGRFPVTLYRSQWLQLIAMVDTIKAFFETHKVQLDAIDEKRNADKE